jgi:hypothetical protein
LELLSIKGKWYYVLKSVRDISENETIKICHRNAETMRNNAKDLSKDGIIFLENTQV